MGTVCFAQYFWKLPNYRTVRVHNTEWRAVNFVAQSLNFLENILSYHPLLPTSHCFMNMNIILMYYTLNL